MVVLRKLWCCCCMAASITISAPHKNADVRRFCAAWHALVKTDDRPFQDGASMLGKRLCLWRSRCEPDMCGSYTCNALLGTCACTYSSMPSLFLCSATNIQVNCTYYTQSTARILCRPKEDRRPCATVPCQPPRPAQRVGPSFVSSHLDRGTSMIATMKISFGYRDQQPPRPNRLLQANSLRSQPGSPHVGSGAELLMMVAARLGSRIPLWALSCLR